MANIEVLICPKKEWKRLGRKCEGKGRIRKETSVGPNRTPNPRWKWARLKPGIALPLAGVPFEGKRSQMRELFHPSSFLTLGKMEFKVLRVI